MEPVFVHRRLDRRHLGDLVPQRLGIIAPEVEPTAAATRWPALGDLADSLGRDQGSWVMTMAWLPTSLLARGGGRRLTEGGSDDGGLEELVESLPSRSSRSAIRRSKDWTRAVTAAWASGESVSQMSCGSGG
jgi:hypothetical protein